MKLTLPPGLTAAQLDAALKEFARVVGEEWVFSTDLDRDTYLDHFAVIPLYLACVTLPIYGLVKTFQMNDRCAAGCGRYLGYVADELNIGLHEQIGRAHV